ncbi:hypothetical protein [Nonomuraea dietziae]|uniref:Uncharacterized protein n=1 Tax=Nonomuraea dietziae TaxID=65515 RepID=A0A7W5VD08_9ACTN|nr:hypothetical protein [Nonomuraea dietziae]MBB3733829.1 hypothetical protein [Nonomuraea dietziae]
MSTSWKAVAPDPRTPARSRSGQVLGEHLPHGIYYRSELDGVREGVAVIDGHVVSRWNELLFPLPVPFCSPWNRILADAGAVGLSVDYALRCHAEDPEHLHLDDGARAQWAACAVLEGLLPYAEVSPRPEQMQAMMAAIEASPLILTYQSEVAPQSMLPTLRVGRTERIGDLWDIPALIHAWEQIDVPEDLAKSERKALDEAQDMRVSDVVFRPHSLSEASWSVMALITGDSPGWAAWESLQDWLRERDHPGVGLPDAAG